MTKFLEKLSVASILALIFIVFSKEFIDIKFFTQIQIILLILVIITCLLLARGISLYVSVLGLVIGHFMLFKYDMGFNIWFEGITKNLPLAILFVMVPILSIPLRLGGYLESFNYYVSKYLDKTEGLFSVLTAFVFTLGSITNLGSIRIAHSLVEEVKFPSRFLAKAYGVGFSACVPWSPYFASVNLVLYYTEVPFSNYFLFGFIYGLLILILGNLLFYRDKELIKNVQKSIKALEKVSEENNKIRELILILVGLLILVILGEKILNFSSMMFLVSLIAVFYAIFWALFIGKFNAFLRELKNYGHSILQVKNELVFFLSVGFLGVILANTPVENYITQFFAGVSGLSTFLLVELILIGTALLSSLGLHHVVTITTLGLALEPSLLGLTDLSFALTLTCAYTVSMIISPFVPFNILAGGLLGENSFVIGLKWNRNYGLLAIILSGLYILIINNFGV